MNIVQMPLMDLSLNGIQERLRVYWYVGDHSPNAPYIIVQSRFPLNLINLGIGFHSLISYSIGNLGS